MKKTAVKAAALMVAVLSALTLVFGTATRASAVSVLDQLIEEIKEAKREIKNVSSLSAQKLMLGETLTMYGKVEGIEPEKCEFGFYVRLNGLFWMTVQSYSSDSVCEWTPTAQGDYEVCIKVKYKTKIEKQYFNIRVSEPLYNHSYVSTSFLQQGETIELTYKEYELLQYLLINAGIVLKRDVLMDRIWGVDYVGESRTLDAHIKSLRKKLGEEGKHIQTIRNVGYMVS